MSLWPAAQVVWLVACAPTTPARSTLPDDSRGATDTADDTGERLQPPTAQPARYPADRLQSPITSGVRDRLRQLVQTGDSQDSQVFMKVGDSITVDNNALHCFAGSHVDLGAHSVLLPALEHFLTGDAAGSTPFDRSSQAAEIGMSATWAISGDPSPLEQELAAITPAFALLQYGTNDMHLGTSFESAIWGYGSNMLDLVDAVLSAGVAPALLTIPPRGDSTDADGWVPSYNTVVRGIAQGRQVPLVDLELGLRGLDSYGLASDGVHLNTYYDGGYRGCVLTTEGLEHGNNTRNLLMLDALDRLRRAALEGEVLDASAPTLAGSGSADDPFLIDSLPFTDLRDTRESSSAFIDSYDGCASSADESGPEVFYALELSEPARIRAMVFDRGEVDIDLHLLAGDASGASCVERDDRILELSLQPGSHLISLDSYVSGGEVHSGEYLLVLVET